MSWTLFSQILILVLWLTLWTDFLLHSQARRASALFKEARDAE